MTAQFKINLQQLDLDFIQRLKEQYADATLEIYIAPATDGNPLSEDEFWKIIDKLDWTANEDDEILQAAVDALAAMPTATIYQFQNILSEKLFQLDQPKYAMQVGYSENQYFSVDGFLYTRACVVANGRTTYEAVLKEEMSMPIDLTFEPILYLAAEAYQQKTGKGFLAIPQYSYETYSNKEAWGEKAA